MSDTNIITGKVRFSYCNVFKARAIEAGQDEKFSVSVIIDKDDKATLAKIERAVAAAKEAGKGKWGGKIPKNLKLPLRDGDVEREDSEGYENSFFLNASSGRKPGIVNANLDEIISQDEFYSGCYGRAELNFYAFDVSGNRGIAVGLNNLQKLEDGEPLGGTFKSAAEVFGSGEDDLL